MGVHNCKKTVCYAVIISSQMGLVSRKILSFRSLGYFQQDNNFVQVCIWHLLMSWLLSSACSYYWFIFYPKTTQILSTLVKKLDEPWNIFASFSLILEFLVFNLKVLCLICKYEVHCRNTKKVLDRLVDLFFL